MTTNNLKQIAKQVSLLNRLIELLRMRETKPDLGIIKQYNWYPVRGFEGYGQWPLIEGSYVKTIEEAWNHEITQKAWLEELVKVARELRESDEGEMCCNTWLRQTLCIIASRLELNHETQSLNPLTLILSRYGRSLSE
jgi:hypothetical protein